jgi:tRNA (guanine-N7-)-methyltransferase
MLMMGAEIRSRVAEFTQSRMTKLREEKPEGHHYNNIWVLRINAMKHLPCYFKKGQLKKIFFMFPDPHFKAKNHRRRIIQQTLLAEYAYILAPGGMIYTITDVEELGNWMQKALNEHPLFERVSDEELANDPLIPHMQNSSEDGIRTTNQNLNKYQAVYRKKQ